MIIHTVKDGEDLFAIARKYSSHVTKIMNDNDLKNDRLVIGDDLLIIIPTKTVTVKGNDTINTICKKYGIREKNLIMQNPELILNESIHPGQIITVKQDNMGLGVASAIGRVAKEARRSDIMKALPFSTYMIIQGARISAKGVDYTAKCDRIADICSANRKIALLGICDESNGEFLGSKETRKRTIDEMIRMAKTNNCKGICINAKDAAERYADGFLEFLLEARKNFLGCDLILFTDYYPVMPEESSELSDGAIIHADDTAIEKTKKLLRDFSSKAESSKVFVSVTSNASDESSTFGINDSKELCYRTAKNISTDKDSLISSFEYVGYKSGIGKKRTISFPSLRYTKAKFESLSELGFMGIEFNVNEITTARLAMFNASFVRGDYSLPYEI